MTIHRNRFNPPGTALSAALCLALLAITAPASAGDAGFPGRRASPDEPRAAATRPSSSSSSSSVRSSGSSSGSRSGSAVRSSSSRSSSRGRSGSSARATRPPSGSRGGSPTVVEHRRDGWSGGHYHRPYRSYGFYHHYPYSWPYNFYGPYFSYGFYGYPWFYPWSWGVSAAVYSSPGSAGDAPGALDLDLRPEKTEIYLDGEYIGVADRFDGFPTYLWLDPGTYDLAFYKEGYATLARQYTVRSGIIIDVEDRMRPGESVRPEELAASSTARRDERLERNQERAAAARRSEGGSGGVLDARVDPGQLVLRVDPPDASVYLDDRFLGTARELAGLHSALIVDPGRHHLEVVRPGFVSREVDFEVASGEEAEVAVTLEEK